MKTPLAIGFQIPKILLPAPGLDLRAWSVIACDQFTSEPHYWQQVASLVGDAPSTFHLILPEVHLDTPDEAQRVSSIRGMMKDYLDRGLFVEKEGVVLVERVTGDVRRHGILLALDLEHYDYRKGSTSLIRATEGTILERIPPRVRIRSGAPLELPHILVLIDDPERTVIEPLVAARAAMRELYDFDLMMNSGHLTGHLLLDKALEQQVVRALNRLADPEVFARKYGLKPGHPVLLFAMGDGNHSLATAKAIWEQIKPQVGPEHPARHALVEVENIHDAGLRFEPIFRVLFGVTGDFEQAVGEFYAGRCRHVSCRDLEEMVSLVEANAARDGAHTIGVITSNGCGVTFVDHPPANLAVGTLQSFLDAWGERGGFARIDYVHGEETVVRLGSMPGNLGFYLPGIAKSDFFKTVVRDGALPRKTFSMGEAREKRFYLEARRIV